LLIYPIFQVKPFYKTTCSLAEIISFDYPVYDAFQLKFYERSLSYLF